MEDEWNEYVMPSSPELVLKTIARLAERDKRYGGTFKERRLDLSALLKPLARIRSVYRNVLSAALQQQPPLDPANDYPPVLEEKSIKRYKPKVWPTPTEKQARDTLYMFEDVNPTAGALLQDDEMPEGVFTYKAEEYGQKMLLRVEDFRYLLVVELSVSKKTI